MTPFEDQASPPPRHHISWSPSKLFCYEGCAAQAKYKYLDKLPDPGGPALVRGSNLHKTVERFITGELEELCSETKASLAYIQPFRDGFKQGTAFAELELAFKPDWTLCGWFDPYVWVRFKLDALLFENGVLKVVDWKSGALRADSDSQYQSQIEMYTLALLEALRQSPKWAEKLGKDVKVTSALWFLDCGKEVPSKIGCMSEKGRQGLRDRWEGRVSAMLGDTLHVPTPSFKCRFCPFSKKAGGPCRF